VRRAAARALGKWAENLYIPQEPREREDLAALLHEVELALRRARRQGLDVRGPLLAVLAKLAIVEPPSYFDPLSTVLTPRRSWIVRTLAAVVCGMIVLNFLALVWEELGKYLRPWIGKLSLWSLLLLFFALLGVLAWLQLGQKTPKNGEGAKT